MWNYAVSKCLLHSIVYDNDIRIVSFSAFSPSKPWACSNSVKLELCTKFDILHHVSYFIFSGYRRSINNNCRQNNSAFLLFLNCYILILLILLNCEKPIPMLISKHIITIIDQLGQITFKLALYLQKWQNHFNRFIRYVISSITSLIPQQRK